MEIAETIVFLEVVGQGFDFSQIKPGVLFVVVFLIMVALLVVEEVPVVIALLTKEQVFVLAIKTG